MRFSSTSINITVIDNNDNAPMFIGAPYSATLPEGLVQTTQQILTLNAEDADSGSNGEIVYSIAGGAIAGVQLDPNTVSCSRLMMHACIFGSTIRRYCFLICIMSSNPNK